MDPRYDLFLGPNGENLDLLKDLVERVLFWQARWRATRYPTDPSLYPSKGVSAEARSTLVSALSELLGRLEANIPFAHPRYAAQMLKDPAVPAVVAYLATMLMNPNNHAYEGGPVTTEMEMEVVEDLKRMLGFEHGWGHLTSGGTLANMEAMWAVRDTLPEGAVAFSAGSHYSWKRICSILGVKDWVELPVDRSFRMDLNELEKVLRDRPVSMVIANLGTTGTGSVDPLPEILRLRDRYGFHLHVDAAYGGYGRSLILSPHGTLRSYEVVEDLLSPETYHSLRALSEADSVTIDPHKHGLVMYGAGGIIFKEEKFRTTILNTAPYTYHVKERPNIGMFTLEGSRPGAAAAAVWFTHRLCPLHSAGIGAILGETIATAREFARRLPAETPFEPLCGPDLDIVCFHPKRGDVESLEEMNRIAEAVYREMSVEAERPPFIFSKFVVDPATAQRAFGVRGETPWVTIRSVFIKHWLRLGPRPTYLDRAIEALANWQPPGESESAD